MMIIKSLAVDGGNVKKKWQALVRAGRNLQTAGKRVGAEPGHHMPRREGEFMHKHLDRVGQLYGQATPNIGGSGQGFHSEEGAKGFSSSASKLYPSLKVKPVSSHRVAGDVVHRHVVGYDRSHLNAYGERPKRPKKD